MGAGDCNRGEGADNELLCGGPFAQGDCTESCVGIVTSVFTAGGEAGEEDNGAEASSIEPKITDPERWVSIVVVTLMV